MTDIQKATIEKMRSQGSNFAQISEFTGIHISSVKTYCYRNNITVSIVPDVIKQEKTVVNKSSCKHCNKQLIHTPKMKKRTFCNDKCRYDWWNRNRKSAPIITCHHCGQSFNSYDKNRKFCKHSCYVASRFGGDCHD